MRAQPARAVASRNRCSRKDAGILRFSSPYQPGLTAALTAAACLDQSALIGLDKALLAPPDRVAKIEKKAPGDSSIADSLRVDTFNLLLHAEDEEFWGNLGCK